MCLKAVLLAQLTSRLVWGPFLVVNCMRWVLSKFNERPLALNHFTPLEIHYSMHQAFWVCYIFTMHCLVMASNVIAPSDSVLAGWHLSQDRNGRPPTSTPTHLSTELGSTENTENIIACITVATLTLLCSSVASLFILP
jgi:hypothetical protein